MAFYPRLSGSDLGSLDYYNYSYPGHAFTIPLPNCTTYAYGRSMEIAAQNGGDWNTIQHYNNPYWWNGQSTFGNAETWFQAAINAGLWQTGSSPALGAIACWSGNNLGLGGHVAVVEEINGSTVTLSNSSYGGQTFFLAYASPVVGQVTSYVGEEFLGYIYNPCIAVPYSGPQLRTGQYGQYWGNDYNSSDALAQSQMELNATYIYHSLTASGWSANAIAAMLGNMQSESTINPGRWEGNNVGSGPGYGLVQWTPYTNYTNWVTGDPSTMDNNLARIDYEVANGLQWISTSAYPMSFSDFKTSHRDPYYLAMAFLKNYERPANPNQPVRGEQARAWYEFITGLHPWTGKEKKGYNFTLFNRRRRVQIGKRRSY